MSSASGGLRLARCWSPLCTAASRKERAVSDDLGSCVLKLRHRNNRQRRPCTQHNREANQKFIELDAFL